MDDARRAHVEAAQRLVDHRLDGALSHAGIVLELHAADAVALARITHRADEAGHRADAAITSAKRCHLTPEVEVFALDAHAGQRHAAHCDIRLSASPLQPGAAGDADFG